MKFKDFKYERPNLEEYVERANKILGLLGENESLETEVKAIKDWFDINDEMESMITLVSIRN